MSEFYVQHSHECGSEIFSEAYAKSLDSQDTLSHMRSEFIFPNAPTESGREKVIYLCGNRNI
jgi:hypothetical protein